MKKCVINYASGAWYPRGQERLKQSLKDTGFDGDVFTWSNAADIGSPTHQEAPYAFKPHALKWAVDKGYEQILWADASVWAIKNIQPMFDHMDRHGYLFFHNNLIAPFTSDRCLANFGMTREEAKKLPMLMGICMGWDMRDQRCGQFLEEWIKASKDGSSFQGSWTNNNREVSQDPECKGHRHDQSVASILACRLEMPYIVAHHHYFMYWEAKMPECIVMTAQGM